jgi:hypothetical protein
VAGYAGTPSWSQITTSEPSIDTAVHRMTVYTLDGNRRPGPAALRPKFVSVELENLFLLIR